MRENLRKGVLSSSPFKLILKTLLIWLLLSVVQTLLLNALFSRQYADQERKLSHRDLAQAAALFSGGDEDGSSMVLRQYTRDHSSPVMVITDDHQIADRELLSKLGLIYVSTDQGDTCKVLISFVYDMSSMPFFAPTRDIKISTLKLGNSNYYEPLSIDYENTAYNNRDTIIQYRLGDGGLDVQDAFISGKIQQVNNIYSTDNLQTHLSKLIYNRVKDCLIQELPVPAFMEELDSDITKDTLGNSYQFVVEARTVSDKVYYFITLQNYNLSAYRAEYAYPLFFGIFFLTGLTFVIGTLLISRQYWKDIEYASGIIEKISKLDFSDMSAPNHRSDSASLFENITQMSNNISSTINSLEFSYNAMRESENRLRVQIENLTHEFKTPLSIISAYTDALDKSTSEEERKEYVGIIDKEITSLSLLVDETMELNKLQTGRIHFDLGVWTLEDLVGETSKKFSKQIEAGGFTLRENILDLTVYADARLIILVLNNFFSNALKYSDADKALSVDTRIISDNTVEISVSNSGSLSENEISKIWKRDYRSGSAEQKARIPGDGIGLDIGRSILDLHHSSYGVRQEGNVTRFYFTLQIFRGQDNI